MKEITIADKSYEIEDDGQIINALAYCYAGDHFSHPYCHSAPEGFEEAEEAGRISRRYNGTGWYWYISS